MVHVAVPKPSPPSQQDGRSWNKTREEAVSAFLGIISITHHCRETTVHFVIMSRIETVIITSKAFYNTLGDRGYCIVSLV